MSTLDNLLILILLGFLIFGISSKLPITTTLDQVSTRQKYESVVLFRSHCREPCLGWGWKANQPRVVDRSNKIRFSSSLKADHGGGTNQKSNMLDTERKWSWTCLHPDDVRGKLTTPQGIIGKQWDCDFLC
uniref:Uncharacterized protein n=1 Tax=Lygus hesperus TaxID=30085 RepID=A0A0A9WNY6_LYGHE